MLNFYSLAFCLLVSFSDSVGRARLSFVTTKTPSRFNPELLYLSFGEKTVASHRLTGPNGCCGLRRFRRERRRLAGGVLNMELRFLGQNAHKKETNARPGSPSSCHPLCSFFEKFSGGVFGTPG